MTLALLASLLLSGLVFIVVVNSHQIVDKIHSLFYPPSCPIISIIIHSALQLFFDGPKAYSEFSKSAPVTSTCRLHNNRVKVIDNHVMHDCSA